MKKIFSPDGLLWRVLNTLTDVFALSVIWLFCCLPVVTIGPATTALYDSVVRCIRYQEAGPYKRFFRTFRADLGVSIFSTILWIAVIGFGLWSLSLLRSLGEASRSAAIASAAYYIIMVLPCGAACWVFPILSRFTYSWKDLNLTALKLSIGYLPRTVILVLLTAETGLLCIRYFFPAFFAPACMVLLWSLFIEPVFGKLGGGLKPDVPEEDSSEDELTES
ncbi:MAG: YesL family protein [Oscillospiraceae bacterium]|nr:YesL family protein [Oscillospiraceae bacterium]MBO7728255.1 YesL family protein [Oscillospiraceae bacterium]